jgi:hypothetical protein
MLTYTSLLIVCLVVSVVAYFLYKVVADSSRSVYRSKAPITLFGTPGHHHKDSVANASVADNAKAFGENRGHSTPRNFAKTYPAMPTESNEWAWQGKSQGNRGQVREPQLQASYAGGNSSHCSLYDVNTPQPAQRVRPNIPKLRREEKVNPVGRTYKVTRKAAHVPGDDHDLNKPWGW